MIHLTHRQECFLSKQYDNCGPKVQTASLVAGRPMTTELDSFVDNFIYSQYGQPGSKASITDPSDSLIDWFVGNPDQRYYNEEIPQRQIAQCSKLEPIPYSPMSPPLEEQGPSTRDYNGEYPEDQGQECDWIRNPHITGMAISPSGFYGTPNYIKNGGCTVCGKSYATIQEEITLGFLEKPHIPEETYIQRIKRSSNAVNWNPYLIHLCRRL